jgi:hypothetical protein
VAVWVILVCRPDGDDHAEQHDSRRENVTREFDAGGDHGCRARDDADDDTERRQERAGYDAGERDAPAGLGGVVEVVVHALLILDGRERVAF